MLKRYDLAIINRSFWPKSQIIGESLLQLCELLSKKGYKVVAIVQGSSSLKQSLKSNARGVGVDFQVSRARTDSSTGLTGRISDMLIFVVWTIWILVLRRPKTIYIATDPPLLVPFIVFLYSKLSRSSYTYHLQDIHPEASNVITNINPGLFSLLRSIDNLVIRNASNVITITKEMKDFIKERSNLKNKIYLLDNPSLLTKVSTQKKIKGFIFAGNAGRLQKIPMLLEGISKYKECGGKLPFLFIGSGVYSKNILLLSEKYHDVLYKGIVDADVANSLITKYEWALLPIEDEVTKYAFPSKTSSYVSYGANILAICSEHTSVARWVLRNNYGISVPPKVDCLVDIFFEIENGLTIGKISSDRKRFSIKNFVHGISDILI